RSATTSRTRTPPRRDVCARPRRAASFRSCRERGIAARENENPRRDGAPLPPAPDRPPQATSPRAPAERNLSAPAARRESPRGKMRIGAYGDSRTRRSCPNRDYLPNPNSPSTRLLRAAPPSGISPLLPRGGNRRAGMFRIGAAGPPPTPRSGSVRGPPPNPNPPP